MIDAIVTAPINKNNIQVILYFIVSIFTTILNVILIKNYKVDGAVYSYLISYAALCVVYFVFYEKYINKLVVSVKKN